MANSELSSVPKMNNQTKVSTQKNEALKFNTVFSVQLVLVILCHMRLKHYKHYTLKTKVKC